MKQILFIFLLGITIVYAKQDTCYSVQLASSFAPFSQKKIISGAKILHIGNVYTLRYGCYEHFSQAKETLQKLQNDYPNAMIVSTYKWRFENNNEKKTISKPKPVEKKEIEKKTVTTYSSPFIQYKPTDLTNEPKCYSIQLFSGNEQIYKKQFPSETKIVEYGNLKKALYGCYTNIEDAKTILYKNRPKYPRSIIVAVPKKFFKKHIKLPEIHKKGVQTYGDALKKQPKRQEKINFLLPLSKETNTTKKNIQCSSDIRENIVNCRGKCQENIKESRWERVNIDAVQQYVSSQIESAQYLNQFDLTTVDSKSLPSKQRLEPTSKKADFLRFYITATLNIKNGQTDKNSSTLNSESLVLSPGLQYLHNFSPTWFFYTDDRLIYSINKSNTNLKFDIKDFYISSRNLFENRANFLIGRKYLKDDRGWYYKTSLDTLAIFNKHDLLLYELYLGTRLNKNTMAYDPNEIQTNLKGAKFLFGHISYEFFKKNTVEGFYIYEDNKNAQKKLGWTGLRLQGELLRPNLNIFSYWIDVASMRGKYQSKNTRGLGYDIGGKYYFTHYYAGIAASLAYGSGGGSRYLQPSFTNNRSNYLSKDVSYRYYGEFLQPELSNMLITTLDFLYHFDNDTNKTAIIALHNYKQDKSSTSQYNATNKTVNPNGKSTNIGNEIDVIIHYDLFANSYWRFSFGYFLGGSAYNKKTGKKDGYNAQIYYRYIW